MSIGRGVANLIVRFFFTKNRSMFIVQMGSALLLANFGIVGIANTFLRFFISGVLGILIEDGTFVIDVGLDKIREGTKLKEFEKEAKAIYEKAMARVYDETEKQKIREQYLAIVGKIVPVGDGPRT